MPFPRIRRPLLWLLSLTLALPPAAPALVHINNGTLGACNAAVNLINTQGDLSEALKLTFSGKAVKGYAGAAAIGGIGGYTDLWGRTVMESGNTLLTDLPERAKAYAINTAAKGLLTGADSGKDWARIATLGLAGELYQYWVGRGPDVRPGVDRPGDPVFEPVRENGFLRVPTVVIDGVVHEGKNTGLNRLCSSYFSICHGTPISNALNMVPGFNAFATVHDTWMNWFEDKKINNSFINLGSMPPALFLNYGSIIDRYYYLKPVMQNTQGGAKWKRDGQ